MKLRAIHSLAFGLFAMTAYGQQPATASSTAQNPTGTPGAAQSQSAKPSTPPKDPTATTSTAPAPPASAKEDKSVNANKQAQQSQLPQSDMGVASLDTSGVTSAQLQQKIEAALHSDPTLSGSNLTVNVTDEEINVNGTVGTGKERTTASRIVQSFGENRKVKQKINVSGVGRK